MAQNGDDGKLVYKIMTVEEWTAFRNSGAFAGAAVDLADGYVHLSGAGQVAETAARHFSGRDDLVLVAIDPLILGQALRWEPSRGGALFPHLYAPLPIAAVRWAEPMPLGSDGAHRLPPL